MLRRPASIASRVVVVGVVAGLTLTLLGCGPATPVRPSASPGAEPAPTPTATTTTSAPAYVAEGSADDNLPLFTAITAEIWASDQRTTGRAYIDALIAAGFDRGAMQVTQDVTTVGNPAESLQFSVRWGDAECLIGQVGPSTGGPVTAVMPQLAEGRCLVGATRPIDW